MKKKIANWGNYPVLSSDVNSFSAVDQLRKLLLNGENYIARGNGRCYGDASLAPNTISTLKFDKIISFDVAGGIFECQSGITLDKILGIIAPHGWFLPVSPGTKFITIGGAVASNVHGKNHHIDGSFGNHIIDMDILLSNGHVITCSPLQYPDLFEATCGGMGLTGIITRVKFRLKKIGTAYIRQKQIKAENLEEIFSLFEEYKHNMYSMAWIDCLKGNGSLGRSILIVGENANYDELNVKQKYHPLVLPEKKQLVFPVNLPSFALNYYSVKAFNFLYYHKNIRKEINNIVPYEPFFYPLDAILHWNRGYGRKGFIQYQFVLPLEASKKGLTDILNRIIKNGTGSFLAVLKLFGKHDSLISFPMEGYTLALDFPVRNGLFSFLDELDKVVMSYGGRLYLSKDARMNPETFWKSYPNVNKFAEIIRKYNPDLKFRSLLSDRLLLTKN